MSLVVALLPLLLILTIVLIIPCLIVGFWKKRPVWAFIVATTVLFVSLGIPVLLQVMVTYSEGDPQLVAGLISQAIMSVVFFLIICVPILWLFQWFVLRRYRRNNPKVDLHKTFS